MADIANDADNVWTDAANVDTHVQLRWTYDYYYKCFGRGLDDNDAPIYSDYTSCAPVDIPSLPGSAIDYVVNAFWCDGCRPAGKGVMVFGEGLQPGFVLPETWQHVDPRPSAICMASGAPRNAPSFRPGLPLV